MEARKQRVGEAVTAVEQKLHEAEADAGVAVTNVTRGCLLDPGLPIAASTAQEIWINTDISSFAATSEPEIVRPGQ